MQQPHILVALVTLLSLLVYFWMSFRVAQARGKSGIQAPAMTGEPVLERTIRAHYNTLEWLPIFLASMWLFAIYWNDMVAAAMGVVWIIGRIAYALGYAAEASKRSAGFLIQSVAVAVLLFGGLGRIIYIMATVHA
jgi:glutathione S-transferase